jgi:ATP/maltotriose-dependent transcriptional regulator MalT
VLELLLEGYSNKEIARMLGLTLGTVKNYVSALLKTAHAKTRSQILAAMRLSSVALPQNQQSRTNTAQTGPDAAAGCSSAPASHAPARM